MKKLLCLTLILIVLMPLNAFAYTMYAPDGRTINVDYSDAQVWRNVGWYDQPVIVVYAPDGRTAVIYQTDLVAWQNVGWYTSPVAQTQTIYAPDGRTATVYRSDVPAYLALGWYESAAQAANAVSPTSNYTSGSKGNTPSQGGTYYITPTGKKYHRTSTCGGKNSFPTTNISGYSPCSKCW